MIHVAGSRKRMCDGFTRRDALTAGGLSLLGMSLPDLLHAEDSGATLPRPRAGCAKSVILVYLFGGPPLHDTFDPKTDAPAEVRGEFGSTPTSVPGVHFCDLLPGMAKWMDRSTLIRSAAHPHNDHSAGLLYTMTGKRAVKLESAVPVLPTQAPSMNSVIQYLARNETRELPASVWMPCYTGWGQGGPRPGPYAGLLGRQYDPFFTACKPYSEKKCKYAYPERVLGDVVLPEMKLADEISIDRLDSRRTLVEQFNAELRRIEHLGVTDRLDLSRRQAFDLLTSANRSNSPWRAFSVDDEADTLKDRYGRNLYGQSMMIARRLVESDVRFVTVTWEVFEKAGVDEDGWDTHRRNFDILRDHRLPVLDRAYSALCEDLDERGLLDETLIVVMGEMGRTPKINKFAGRDHWSFCHNVLLTGAGVKQGHVYGSSDRIGAYPAADPVGPEDLIATIYGAMGIDADAVIPDQSGRPHPIAQRGSVIHDILG
ncbi:MAG: hypothetical protein CMJ70_14695 [Planctomycetaceae bacterium]|nr:hypothetical protein [Planctomycetaceae bacterium]